MLSISSNNQISYFFINTSVLRMVDGGWLARFIIKIDFYFILIFKTVSRMNTHVITVSKDFKDMNDKELMKKINIMLDKNEEAIIYYISRYIYTSSISNESYQEIEKIFQKIRDDLHLVK